MRFCVRFRLLPTIRQSTASAHYNDAMTPRVRFGGLAGVDQRRPAQTSADQPEYRLQSGLVGLPAFFRDIGHKFGCDKHHNNAEISMI